MSKELLPCPLCGEELVYRIERFADGSNPLNTAYCHCGFVFSSDLPADEFIRLCNRRATQKRKSASGFQKPTIEQIQEFCKERNNAVDPQRFYNFYESKGWRVGNQPMKDWQAAIRTWESRDAAKPNNQFGSVNKKGKPVIEQHNRTDAELSHLLVDLDADYTNG